MRLDPLSRLPLDQELRMKQLSSQRQLESLEILLVSEQQRLDALNEAARQVLWSWQLPQRLALRRGDVEDPASVTHLDDLIAAPTGDLSSSDITASKRASPPSFVEFMCRYPRFLLEERELHEVDALKSRSQECHDQMQLLEMLQLHEAQTLAATECRLRGLKKPAGSKSTELAVAYEPVAFVASSLDGSRPQSTDDACVQEGDCDVNGVAARALWTNYFMHSQRLVSEDVRLSDDQRCCILIEELLDRCEATERALRESDAHLVLTRKREDEHTNEIATLRHAKAQLEEALTSSAERCQELVSLVEVSRGKEAQTAFEAFQNELCMTAASERHERELTEAIEDAQRHALASQCLHSVFCLVTQSNAWLQETLTMERHSAEVAQADAANLMADKESIEATVAELREEVAALGAERALLQAKVEMVQGALQLDAERYRRSLDARDSECAALRHRLIDAEAQLEVLQSKTITRVASMKAVAQQQLRDQRSEVKSVVAAAPHSPTKFCSVHSTASPPPRVLVTTAKSTVTTDSEVPPSPRADQPPTPTQA